MEKDSDNWNNKCEQNIITDRLKNDLIDIKKDIDLNYRRVTYTNPSINLILKSMVPILEGLISMLNFPDKSEYIHEKEGTKKPHSFGISRKDL